MELKVRRNGDTMTRWDPFTELSQLTEQLERFLETGSLAQAGSDGFTPLGDIEETEDAFVIELELPGVDRDDVSVEVDGRRLVVSGERKERERTGVIRRRTRTVGRFHYEVVLPSDVDGGAVEAKLEHGVLSIRVPKAVGNRPSRITVK